MKKKIGMFLIALAMICTINCACSAEQEDMSVEESQNPAETICITFRNNIQEADVWIIPNTEENRKTSLWGAASIAKSKIDTDSTATVEKSADESYLLRMIDMDGMYYASEGIVLSEGSTITVRLTAQEAEVEVTDAAGAVIYRDVLFCAAL